MKAIKVLMALLLVGLTTNQAFGQNSVATHEEEQRAIQRKNEESVKEWLKEEALIKGSVKPFHQEGWAREQAFFKERRAEFLKHVQGAKNIVVAKGTAAVTGTVVGYDGISDWKINWAEQRKFCTKVAKVLFSNPTQMSFPEPNFSAYRDPSEKFLESPALSYPACPGSESGSSFVAAGAKILQRNSDWLNLKDQFKLERMGSQRYYYSPQFYMREQIGRIYDEDDPSNQNVLDKRQLMIEYGAGISERGCGVWGGNFQDHNPHRDINSKVVAGVIDGEFVFFEFGTYSNKTGIADPSLRQFWGDWFGKPNQRYVLATGARHNLNHTLVTGKGQQSKVISSGEFPSGRDRAPYAYGNACVFNFDLAVTPSTSKPKQ